MPGGVPPIIDLRDLDRSDHSAACSVLARGMRDNPLHLAAFGDDPERRRRSLERMFATLFRVSTDRTAIGAFDSDELVGLTGIAPAGRCQPGVAERLRFLPAMAGLGPRGASRVGRWLRTWAEHDPDEPHSHLGPLAVDAHLQGQGIGTRILGEYCRRLDADGEVGYLETDKPENVRLYERAGFVVVGEAPVIGVTNWFMRREPGGASAA